MCNNWIEPEELKRLTLAAEDPDSRYLAVTRSNNEDCNFLSIGGFKGRTAKRVSGLVTDSQLQAIIEKFDPNGSARERADMNNVNFVYYR